MDRWTNMMITWFFMHFRGLKNFDTPNSTPYESPHAYHLNLGLRESVNQLVSVKPHTFIETSDWSVYNLKNLHCRTNVMKK